MTESTGTASLAEAFQAAMADYFGDLSGPVGVMVEVLGSDQALTWNHTGVFPTASTLKIPLLYELYRQVDAGQVDLKERVTLRHAGRVPGSGVYQHLDDGLTPTVRDLAELMITVSDNWATDILFGRLGKDSVASTLADLGLTQTFLPLTIHELFCALAGLDQADPAAEYEALRDFLKTYNPEPDSVGLAADSRNDVSSPADMVRLMALIDAGHGLIPTPGNQLRTTRGASDGHQWSQVSSCTVVRSARQVRHRATRASSSASRSAKPRLATASLTSGHNRSAGCSSGEYGGSRTRSIPSGTTSRALVWPPAPSQTSTTRFVASIPSSWANVARAAVIATADRVGSRHHQLSPVVGRTKP
jgi:hypothetical protein